MYYNYVKPLLNHIAVCITDLALTYKPSTLFIPLELKNYFFNKARKADSL